jgi:hypothetical protein
MASGATPSSANAPGILKATSVVEGFRIHPDLGPDGVLHVSVGDPVVVNGASLASVPPAPQTYLIVNWGDDGNQRVGCGPCRLTHGYDKPGSYVLQATVDDLQPTGQARAATNSSVSVPVEVAGGVTVNFSATPRIPFGGTATLAWTTTGATSVDIAGVGTFGPSGSVNVSPSATTTYSLVAHGPAGTATASATVIVSLFLSIDLTPTVIGSGQVADLTWDAPTATTVTLSTACSPVFPPPPNFIAFTAVHGDVQFTGTTPTSCTLTVIVGDGVHTSTESRTLTVQ